MRECITYAFMSMMLISIFMTVSLTTGYTSCDGIQKGDLAVIDYNATVQSTGNVFDSTKSSGPATFTISPTTLIEGFYEGMLGMKVGERKMITVPPEKGYTDPNSSPEGLYGETLIFDVFLHSVKNIVSNCSGSSDPTISTPVIGSNPLSLDFNFHTILFSMIILPVVIRNRIR